MHVGYELAIIISSPTSAGGIIVLLKTPTKYREFFPTFLVKTIDFQVVVVFLILSRRVQSRTVTVFGEHGMIIGLNTMIAKQSSRSNT